MSQIDKEEHHLHIDICLQVRIYSEFRCILHCCILRVTSCFAAAVVTVAARLLLKSGRSVGLYRPAHFAASLHLS